MKLKTAFLVGSLLSLASLGVQAQTQAPPTLQISLTSLLPRPAPT